MLLSGTAARSMLLSGQPTSSTPELPLSANATASHEALPSQQQQLATRPAARRLPSSHAQHATSDSGSTHVLPFSSQQLPPTAVSPATQLLPAASAISSSSAVSGPARLFTSAVHDFRLTVVYSRLSTHLNEVARFEASEVIGLCYTLAIAIDCSLTLKDIPGIAPRLPPLVKKVYEWRKHAALQSAIMMVLISMKNACKRGWFQPADSEELLCIVDEMCSKFYTELCPNDQANYAFDTISKIMPKFYPRLKLCSLIATFEAKPGYDVLISISQRISLWNKR